MKKPLLFLMAASALLCVSCRHNGLYPVRGKATYKGEPAAGAFVYLVRPNTAAGDDSSIMGVVDEDGTFRMVCDAKGDGAPPGSYAVLIKWPAAGRNKSLANKVPDRLQGRYADPKNPRWRAEVKAGTNDLPPFELTE